MIGTRPDLGRNGFSYKHQVYDSSTKKPIFEVKFGQVIDKANVEGLRKAPLAFMAELELEVAGEAPVALAAPAVDQSTTHNTPTGGGAAA